MHQYPDGYTCHYEEEELRPMLDLTQDPQRVGIISEIQKMFTYLHNRMHDNCAEPYKMSSNVALFKAVRMFDPKRAVQLMTTARSIDVLAAQMPLLDEHNLVARMKSELASYLLAAQPFDCDTSDIAEYTIQVLAFWKEHGKQWPALKTAARMVFAMSPNSASCERVFSLLKAFFGDGQDSLYADFIELALMRAFNKRG